VPEITRQSFSTKPVDLVSVLQQSLDRAKGGKTKPEKKRKKAA